MWFYVVVALFSALWSSAFVVGKIALADLDPFTMLSLRFVLSCLLLLPFVLVRPTTAFDQRTIVLGTALGLLNNAVYLGLTFTALTTIRPELVVVVVSCAPFMTTMLVAALGMERLSGRKLAGITIGFFGVVVISGVATTGAPDPLGVALAVAGTAAFATGTVLFRGKAAALPVLPLNFWQSAVGGLALLPVALMVGGPWEPPSVPATLAIVYLAVVVTIGGMALWLVLIRTSGAATASSYHLLNPFFGVLLSCALLGTAFQPADVLGAAIIALGLGLTVRSRS